MRSRRGAPLEHRGRLRLPTTGVLTVWLSKFGKSRLVPLSASTSAALDRYRAHRSPRPRDTPACSFAAPDPRRSGSATKVQPGLHTSAGLDGDHRPRRAPSTRCTTCATASPCAPSRAGIATAPTSRRCCHALSTYLGHVEPSIHLLVSVRRPRADGPRRRTPRTITDGARPVSTLAPILESFFTDRLGRQLHASPPHRARLPGHVPAAPPLRPPAHRQTAVPAGPRRPRRPADQPDSWTTSNTTGTTRVRTRNARLAAIRSMFRYASYREPAHAGADPTRPGHPRQTCPPTRPCRILSPAEIDAAHRRPRPRHLARPTRPRPARHRHPDRATRLRTHRGLRCHDVVLGTGAHVRCYGKGRKERCTPLTRHTVERAARLARRARPRRRPAGVPHPRRRSAQPGLGRRSRRPARRHRPPALPRLDDQEGDARTRCATPPP